MSDGLKASEAVQQALDRMSNTIWELKSAGIRCREDQKTYDHLVLTFNELLTELYKATGAKYHGYDWELAGRDPKDVL